MVPDKTQLAALMRKTAEKLREEALEIEKAKTTKCAQALNAARGLAQLQRILGGAER